MNRIIFHKTRMKNCFLKKAGLNLVNYLTNLSNLLNYLNALNNLLLICTKYYTKNP